MRRSNFADRIFQGLCGQYDGVLQNEYLTREGDILTLDTVVAGEASENEWTMGRSWMWDDGQPGPNPTDVPCEDRETTLKVCEELLNSESLADCKENVEFATFLKTCKELIQQ